VAGKPRRPFVLQGVEEIPSKFTVSSNPESVDQLEADTSHFKNLASTYIVLQKFIELFEILLGNRVE